MGARIGWEQIDEFRKICEAKDARIAALEAALRCLVLELTPGMAGDAKDLAAALSNAKRALVGGEIR